MSEDKKTYEELVQECAEIRRDLDVVLHPIFWSLKKAFAVVFDGLFAPADFKRLSDQKYYQGGYPTPNSPPKSVALADQVASIIRLEELTGSGQLRKLLNDRGVTIDYVKGVDEDYTLSTKAEMQLQHSWQASGIDVPIPMGRTELLKTLLERAQVLQAEICQTADTIKVDAAEVAESEHKIAKGNFVKAVGLAAIKLRRGEGPMLEKIEAIHDAQENMNQALEPLEK